MHTSTTEREPPISRDPPQVATEGAPCSALPAHAVAGRILLATPTAVWRVLEAWADLDGLLT